MKELQNVELENINGGINWADVIGGASINAGIIVGAILCPEAVIPAYTAAMMLGGAGGADACIYNGLTS